MEKCTSSPDVGSTWAVYTSSTHPAAVRTVRFTPLKSVRITDFDLNSQCPLQNTLQSQSPLNYVISQQIKKKSLDILK